MIYLKGLSKIVFFVALLAIGNSLIVQPALEIQQKHVAAHAAENSRDESDCCFICHPAHFQWIANASAPSVSRIISTSFIQPHTFTAYPDPRIGSIFRPPLAF